MTIEELKTTAAEAAQALRESSTLSKELRGRFIAVRTELIRRGVFNPVLLRFDTVTVPRASMQEIADQLAAVASSLTVVPA